MRPVRRWSALTCAKMGIASSAPITAIGTIGTPARSAVFTKPPRPKRRSREACPESVQEPLRVGGVRRDEPDLVREHPHARVALEPVLAEHVERPPRGVLVAQRL